MAETASAKRRSGKRTARACDECRLRKSKCDGLNPCEACQLTDRYCTYNLSAARSTGSGTRIRILEDRLRRARAYLTEAQRRTPSLANINFDALLGPTEEATEPEPRHGSASSDAREDNQEKLDSMMGPYGQMTLSTNGSTQRDFYGAASGFAWIEKTRTWFADSDSDDEGETDETTGNTSAATQLFDAPLPRRQDLPPNPDKSELLPPREDVEDLQRVVFTQVYSMFHFLDEQEFERSTRRIYDQRSNRYTEEDQKFLHLFYLVMSLGYLFSRDKHHRLGCRMSVNHGMRLFIAARSMLDIAHLRDIVSLQSVICLILYLISTARMGSAHAFLGAACASALRQGLHFRTTHENAFGESEARVRRRVFWAVINLDLYISSILGLPAFMTLSEIDPAIDLTIASALQEVQTGELSPSEGLSLLASARHIELMRIVFKAQKTLFPKPQDPPKAKQQNSAILVSVSKLRAVEHQLSDWTKSVIDILTYPSDTTESRSIKYEIKISYYFSQIVLYRAFLHYLAKSKDENDISEKHLEYARTCVKMATKVIEVSIEQQKNGLLCPASWASVYTVFISTVCLTFAYAVHKEDDDMAEAKETIENAIRLLATTACSIDTGSVRCLEILRRLIKRVNYTVDIDVDTLCASTAPCCTSSFGPHAQHTQYDVEMLLDPIQARSISEGVSSSQSTQLLSPSERELHGRSFNSGSSQPQGLERSQTDTAPRGQSFAQNYYSSSQDELSVPYAGTFSWPSHEFHSVAARLGLGEQEGVEGQASEQSGTAPSRGQRLSADDIAAFMHINAVDEPFRDSRREMQ